MNISEAIGILKQAMSENGLAASTGLGNKLFEFVSSLSPIANVDLLVYNEKGQFLLSWRDDPHCGTGWHVPGGCIRFKETFDARIRKVAKQELGLDNFTYDKDPIKVFEIFSTKARDINDQNERAHFITLVFKCYAPIGFQPDNGDKSPSDAGYIKWFDTLPADFLTIQECYKEIIK